MSSTDVLCIQHHHFYGSTTTVSLVTLRNGYQIVGASNAADPARFNPEVGRAVATQRALDQIHALKAFQLLDNACVAEEFTEACTHAVGN